MVPSDFVRGCCVVLLATAACVLVPRVSTAQAVNGRLIVMVVDGSGEAIEGARVSIASPTWLGGRQELITREDGKARFDALTPGVYELSATHPGFTSVRQSNIRVGVGESIERRLAVVPHVESVVVEVTGSGLDAVPSGLSVRFGIDDITRTPTNRAGIDNFIRLGGGISATSPSGTQTTFSVLGSSVNENVLRIDGTNVTSPSNGAARADPGIDIVQEIQAQLTGASAEYGGGQAGMINVVTRQGSASFLYEATYHMQPASFVSQPIRLEIPGADGATSGYERARYRDFATTFGGPAIRDTLWFFGAYQSVRDYDSQPGTDPRLPRTNEQDRLFGKLTWRFSPRLRMVQSVMEEFWVAPEQPTLLRPRPSTVRFNGRIPAITLADVTYAHSDRTLFEARAGISAYYQYDDPWPDGLSGPSRSDQNSRTSSGAPPQIGEVTTRRLTAKVGFSRYVPSIARMAHEFKIGGDLDRGEHDSLRMIPFGERFVDRGGAPFQRFVNGPSVAGGVVISGAAFVQDRFTIGDLVTVDAGLRFDYSQAISQDLPARDANGVETGAIIAGPGTLYSLNNWSPRVGLAVKLRRDGPSVLRADYGRYHQRIFTGEVSPFSPGVTNAAVYDYERSTGGYTALRSLPPRVELESHIQSPHTDAFSVSLERRVARQFRLSLAYVHKQGTAFTGWTDAVGAYREGSLLVTTGVIGHARAASGTGETGQGAGMLSGAMAQRAAAVSTDGLSIPLWVLDKDSERAYRLTNPKDAFTPKGYFTTYDGLIVTADKLLANHWHMVASYTWSRAYGLIASSGTSAAGAQLSTVGSPPNLFGRDPNDVTNATGRLPNDRPHMLKSRVTFDVPGTGLLMTASFQHLSGKPWAGSLITGALPAPQSRSQRILVEPRGTRRLSSQDLLDVRIGHTFRLGSRTRITASVDVLNVLNDQAEESLVSDEIYDALGWPTTPQPSLFVDPRRVMLNLSVSFGR